MIFVNFKAYEQGTGTEALLLVKIMEEVVDETGVKIIPVVQSSDLLEITTSSRLEVWTQKVDPINYGAHTGGILPEAVKEDGAIGTFLNHSEMRFPDFESLEVATKRCLEIDLKTLIFAGNLKELSQVLKLNPTFVSYEPPELVGSETTSVAKEKPEIILEAVNLANDEGVPLVVGAGIKDIFDVKKCVELGAVGIAVASGVVKASHPKSILLELANGFI